MPKSLEPLDKDFTISCGDNKAVIEAERIALTRPVCIWGLLRVLAKLWPVRRPSMPVFPRLAVPLIAGKNDVDILLALSLAATAYLIYI